MKNAWKWLLLFVVALPVMAWADDAVKTEYKILKTISLKGDGGWDYLKADVAQRRLFITHDTMVQVLNMDTLKLEGTIAGTQRAHGVAWAPKLGKGFISSGATNSVLVFDLKSLSKKGFIKTGKNPDAIVYEQVTGKIFAFNGEDGTATVIDAATGKVAATLVLGGKPEFAATDESGHVFNNLEDKNQVIEIDAKTGEIINRWPLTLGDSPSGLAMDVKNNRLFIGCHNEKMVVMDSQTGKEIQAVPIGKGIDATAFNPKSGMIYNSCGSGTLTVIHEDSPDQYSVVQNAETRTGSRTMAVDDQTDRVFLPAALFELPSATPTPDQHKARPKMIPGSFEILVVGPQAEP
jgi:YVTN family beta-propeller protein